MNGNLSIIFCFGVDFERPQKTYTTTFEILILYDFLVSQSLSLDHFRKMWNFVTHKNCKW